MRLKKSDCAGPGILRLRSGKGFTYRDQGETIRDKDAISRIKELAIPPAWQEVWICPFDNGHIQATGIDDAGRKQYLYHLRWRESRDREKFEAMEDFARSLPRLRKRLAHDFSERGLTRNRVLACSIRILDLGALRIGSEQYAEENETYGLATLRKKHLEIRKDKAIFTFTAKGSKTVKQSLQDPDAVKVLKSLKNRKGGGYELLAYCQGKNWRDITSSDINSYIKEATGGDFSAKDFRTWNATVLAATGLAKRVAEGERPSRNARKRIANEVVKEVAEMLHNTPAVCRASYIDPRVFDRFDANLNNLRPVEDAMEAPGSRFPAREKIESAVLELLG